MNYHNITYPDMNNGDGLRVVLWLSGCSHYCKGCQNPQTWNTNSGIPFDKTAKEELFRELEKDYISGVTFSGGDPLHINNIEEVMEIILEIKNKFPNKTIWLYTGYNWEDCVMQAGEIVHSHNGDRFRRQCIVEECDVLVDGFYDEKKRDVSLKWRGSSNQRVIAVQESLKQNKVVLHCD